uniref:Uncharacterized protein n=1 Tax=Arundo donax TaxID=35708 RepID=A0A0A9CCG3_ARUDO
MRNYLLSRSTNKCPSNEYI